MRVLYVCTGNSFRSPVAEALTRRYRPAWEVESAGTAPADHVAQNARELLRKEGAERFVKPQPEPVTRRALDAADTIVAMEEEHRDVLRDEFGVAPDRVRVWRVRDPIDPSVAAVDAFRVLKRRVRNTLPER